MRDMYVILCVTGWVWTFVALAYLGWRLRKRA
jgi:hypothetical protein